MDLHLFTYPPTTVSTPGSVFGMLKIRPARPDELDELGALTRAAYDLYRSHIPEPHWSQNYAPRLADPRRRDRVLVHLVAEADGRLVGGVTVVESEEDPGLVWFRYLATAPGFAGKGVGRALLHAVFAFARGRGAHTVAWKTASYMAPAVAFYERLGYEPDPERQQVPSGATLLTYRAAL